MKKQLILTMFIALFLIDIGFVSADTALTKCGPVAGGNYYLTGNIDGGDGTNCINTEDYPTIDLMGYTISTSNSISVFDGIGNGGFNIKNGKILNNKAGGGYAITGVDGAGYLIFNNLTINGTIYLYNNNYIQITNSNITASSDGIVIDGDGGSYHNYITNVTISGAYNGIKLTDGTIGNIINNVNSSSNYYHGIDSYSSNNLFTNIVTNNNAHAGIRLGESTAYSSGNVLTNITANSNNDAGIWQVNSAYNILTNIIVNSNGYGLLLNPTTNHNIYNNITANSNTAYGIYVDGSGNNSISNAAANSNAYGIVIIPYSVSVLGKYNTLTNLTLNSNTNYGIQISSASNTLKNVNAWNCLSTTQACIGFVGGYNGAFYDAGYNNTITGGVLNKSNNYLIAFSSLGDYSTINNTVKDMTLISPYTYGVASDHIIDITCGDPPCGSESGIETNNQLINVTQTNESVDSSGQLIRKWYYQAFVNYSNGTAVNNINVTAYNVTNNYIFNLTTDSSGYTPQTTIIDYINNGGTRTYQSPYNNYANGTLQTWNVTAQHNNIQVWTISLNCWTFLNKFLSIPPSCGWVDLGAIINSLT